MASIKERSGKFHVAIRKKEKTMFASFHDRETAETWGRYHEELIDNFENFQVPAENLITLDECVDLKLENVRERQLDKRTLNDFENVKEEFKEIMSIPLGKLTADDLKNLAREKSQEIVRQGGNSKNNTGSLRISSPATLLRKFRVLSAVIGYMIEKGANITNPAQVVVNQIKMSLLKKGQSIDEGEIDE